MSEALLIPTVSAEQIDQIPVHDFRRRTPYEEDFQNVQPHLYAALNVQLVPKLRIPPAERQPLLSIYGFVYEAISQAVTADEGLLLRPIKALPEVGYKDYANQLELTRQKIIRGFNPVGAIRRHQLPLFGHIDLRTRALPISEGSLNHCRMASCVLFLTLENQLWGQIDQQFFPSS